MTASIKESSEGIPPGDVEKASPASTIHNEPPAETEEEYPPFARVVFIMAALYLCVFIVALVSLNM